MKPRDPFPPGPGAYPPPSGGQPYPPQGYGPDVPPGGWPQQPPGGWPQQQAGYRAPAPPVGGTKRVIAVVLGVLGGLLMMAGGVLAIAGRGGQPLFFLGFALTLIGLGVRGQLTKKVF